MAINVIAFVVITLLDGTDSGNGPTSARLALYGPALRDGEWWRLFTYSVVHFGLLHIASNLFVLWIVARIFEPGAGSPRFATLYVVSVLGGAAGAIIASPHAATGGASGGVFGVAAAATLVMQRRGVRFWDTGLGPLLLINLGLGLFISNISLGGHIGGMVAGGVAAEGMMLARRAGMPALGYAAGALVGLVAVAVAFGAA